MNIKFLCSFIIIALFQSLSAQDYLYLRNKEVLEVKVIELGVQEIKYKDYPAKLDQPIKSIEKSKVEKLTLEDGTNYTFENENINNKDYYAGQKTNALKLDFLSPLNSVFVLCFEKSIKPGMSYEIELGGIGLGYDFADLDPRGVFFRGGVKFIRQPDFYNPGVRYGPILQGTYIKPQLVYTNYVEDNFYNGEWNPDTYEYEMIFERERKAGFGFLITLGKQYVFSNIILLDINLGLGYGGSNKGKWISYGFLGATPLIFHTGFRLGVLL